MAVAQLNGTADAEEERAGVEEAPPPRLARSPSPSKLGEDLVSRRALLGAALGVPLVSPAAAPPPGCTRRLSAQPVPPSGMPPAYHAASPPSPSLRDREDEWRSALAAFHAAQVEVHRIEAATAGASVEEEEAWLPAHDAACDRLEAALDHLLTAPAPSLPALAAKLDLLFTHAIEPGAVDDAVTAALLADSRCLLLSA